MKVKNISGIRAGVNKLVVKLNKLNDSIKFGDGTELFLETKYEPANHTQVIGTVVAVPDKLYFNKKNGDKSMEHETTMEVLVGDTIYMEYFGVMMALADRYDQAATYPDPRWFEHDGSLYVVIRYEEAYFVIRDNTIIPVNHKVNILKQILGTKRFPNGLTCKKMRHKKYSDSRNFGNRRK